MPSLHSPPSFFFSLRYILCMMPYDQKGIWVYEKYLLGQMGSTLTVVSPPKCLCSPSLLTTHWQGAVGSKKKPWLCKHCSAAAIKSLYFQHYFQHKSKMKSHTSCCDADGLYCSQNQPRARDNQCWTKRRQMYT